VPGAPSLTGSTIGSPRGDAPSASHEVALSQAMLVRSLVPATGAGEPGEPPETCTIAPAAMVWPVLVPTASHAPDAGQETAMSVDVPATSTADAGTPPDTWRATP